MKEISYQVGLLVGSNLSNQVNPEDMDLLSVARGIEDAINGSADDATMDKAARAVQAYMQDVLTARAKESLGEEIEFLTQSAVKFAWMTHTFVDLQSQLRRAND